MFQIRLEKGKLKLNINLGAGESELFSPKGTLNDTQWHHVNIVRREANLTMKVIFSTFWIAAYFYVSLGTS